MIINRVITAYRVEESWVIKEEPGIQTIFVLDEDEAKRKLTELVQTESTEGCILEWSKDCCGGVPLCRGSASPIWWC